jgi:hypothetical protein
LKIENLYSNSVVQARMTKAKTAKATIFHHSYAHRFICKCGYEKDCKTEKESNFVATLHKKVCSIAGETVNFNHLYTFSRRDGDRGQIEIERDRQAQYEKMRFNHSRVRASSD